jgi:iron(III) transport system substrate-binding protein
VDDLRRGIRSLLDMLANVSLVLLTACSGTAVPAETAKPSAPAPAATAAAAAAPSGAQDARWSQFLAAGRAEGKVVVMGSPISPLMDAYTKQFPQDTGIQLEYLSVPTGEIGVRAPREAASGHPSFDVAESGAFPMDELEPKGLLQPIKPLLVLPEVTDPTAWRGDSGVSYMDEHAQDIPRPTASASPLLFINTTLVQPGSIKSATDLLDPKWKGKIVATDPRVVGPGQASAAYLDATFGPDFIMSLFKGQAVVLVKEDRQAGEGVARGTYAAALGVSTQSAEAFRTENLPITAEAPPESPGYLSGGFSPLALVKGAPHPNAAAVFLNWALSKAGQTAYSQATLEVSQRKDVSTAAVPAYRVPKDGVTYLDTYSYDYYVNRRRPLTTEVVNLLSQ